MKKTLLIFILTLITSPMFSQISFEKGYFINNVNKKVECFIKNIDWKDNPTHFNYKLSSTGDIKSNGIDNVKEFGIHNFSKYLRATVDIDRSSESLEHISLQKAPTFKKETLFLKLLVSGQANLYAYEDSNLIRFFYNKEDNSIEQLIYKSYQTSDEKIAYNNHFRVQIWNGLKCRLIKMNDLKYLAYDKTKLTNLFVKFNNCNNSESINYTEKDNIKRLNLNLKPRISSNSLEITNINNGRFYDFGRSTNFEFGLEIESVFAFNKSKWALVAEINFLNSLKSEIREQSRTSSLDKLNKIDYSSVEIGFGARHYMFLNEDSKFFINAFYILDLPGNSKLTEETIGTTSTISTSKVNIENNSYTSFGLGYKYNNKYSVEIRLDSTNSIFNPPRNSDYTGLSLILGYTIL